jgi:endonuclease III-like uncharacterized protein
MNEPSGWWPGQRIVTLFGLVCSMLLDEKGHWRSSASAMASVLQMEELS